ncbi:hypothetical protein COE14_30545 [Bacillus thuringiensis]|nr:hypothetical protein CN418_28545 [Bacillus thuringiensis]PGW44838.1 hypothetical protein COE14_30545 [Bacillus thuringiensis]
MFFSMRRYVMQNIRQAHPYYMYEEICEQVSYLNNLNNCFIDNEQIIEIVNQIKYCRRVFITGCGTSYHVALTSEYISRMIFKDVNLIRSVPAFELIHHPWNISSEDVVIAVSHSGETTMVLKALENVRAVKAKTILITGFPESSAAQKADHVISNGYPFEKSLAHTISYTVSIGAILSLFYELSKYYGVKNISSNIKQEFEKISQLVEETILSIDKKVSILSRELQPANNWIFAGTGVGESLAREAALKFVETSYSPAIGIDIEQVLHGYLPMCNSNTVLTIISPPLRVINRINDLIRAAEKVNSKVVIFTSQDFIETDKTRVIKLPYCDELTSALVGIIPLQLMAYYVSVTNGYNPDLIRRDQSKYMEARRVYE